MRHSTSQTAFWGEGMLVLMEGCGGLLYFLFVLMCPTWPQLAHFRVVPVAILSTLGALAAPPADAGVAPPAPAVDPGDPASPAPAGIPWALLCISFCCSRACRRALFFSNRSSSFLILWFG